MAYQVDEEKRVNETSRTQAENDSSFQSVITVDYERYAHMLETSDMSEDQKRAFLQAIWNIIVEFVSLGFGVHPLQQAKNDCGQDKENLLKPTLTAPDQLYLDDEVLSVNFEKVPDTLGQGDKA